MLSLLTTALIVACAPSTPLPPATAAPATAPVASSTPSSVPDAPREPVAVAPTPPPDRSAALSSDAADVDEPPLPVVELDTPTVPPLLRGEIASRDMPNFFDPLEAGVLSLAVYGACLNGFETNLPEASEEFVISVCMCWAAAARANVRAGKPLFPAKPQIQVCGDHALKPGGPVPFEAGLRYSTKQIGGGFGACFDSLPKDLPVPYSAMFCACAVNSVINQKTQPGTTADDFVRCEVAARYQYKTGTSLTRRQFAALSVTSPAPPSVHAPTNLARTTVAPVTSGLLTAAPSAGNGLGPTACADGSWSNSNGRGTCSHHGGESGGRHRRGGGHRGRR